jgi:hypothetical protein
MRFGSSGVQVRSGSAHVGLSLRAVGYGASLQAVTVKLVASVVPNVTSVAWARSDSLITFVSPAGAGSVHVTLTALTPSGTGSIAPASASNLA